MILPLLLLLTVPDGLAARNLDGATVHPFAGSQLTTVFVFVHPDCPVSSRYAPELNRLHDEFTARGIRIWLVYPGRQHDEAAIRTHYREHALRAPALRDPMFDLADRTGATMTPEAVVYARSASSSQEGPRLVYRGRIDDRAVRLGLWRATAGARDLASVLDRLARGEAVVPFTTQAVGCYIKPLS